MRDTNVIVDVLTEREPFIEDSYKVLKLCEEHNFANPVINRISTILSSENIYLQILKNLTNSSIPFLSAENQ